MVRREAPRPVPPSVVACSSSSSFSALGGLEVELDPSSGAGSEIWRTLILLNNGPYRYGSSA